jgi:ribosomal protein L16 Arg81 hydroxylase
VRADGGELRRLLAPLTPRRFLARHWGQRPAFIAGSPRKFAGLGFTLRSLTRAIAPRVPPGRLEVLFVGADYQLAAGPARPDAYRPADGLSLKAHRICDRVASLASVCAGIKMALALPGEVSMTAYAVPAGNGFRTHYDCQPNFILQIEGTKRWRFAAAPDVPWPPANVSPSTGLDELRDRFPFLQVSYPPDERSFQERVLSPGDVLFLPAGTWHQTESIDHSLSLTMTCVPATAADLIDDSLRAALGTAETWRRNVPPVLARDSRPGRLPAPVERFLEARLAELRALVPTLRAADLYESWCRRVGAVEAPLATTAKVAVPALAPDDVLAVARDVPIRYVVDRRARTITIHHLGQRLELSDGALPLLEALGRRSRFRARSAARWLGGRYGWAQVGPLLQELLRVGILRPAADPAGPPTA